MLKLEATLVATTAVRPSRDGWSPDRGVDFVVWTPMQQTIAATSAAPAPIVTPERASFLEADDILPPGMAVVRRYVSLAAQAAEAEAAARENADLPLTRAWSSVARKVPRS